MGWTVWNFEASQSQKVSSSSEPPLRPNRPSMTITGTSSPGGHVAKLQAWPCTSISCNS